MNTAIPMQDDRIASHFTKADHFIFLDDQGVIKSTKSNPATDSGCSGKSALHKLIIDEKAQRVIVRNIGQRSLAKLLAKGLQVFQAQNGHFNSQMLTDNRHLTPLVHAEQGRVSIEHNAKKSDCGCNSPKSDKGKGRCCQK